MGITVGIGGIPLGAITDRDGVLILAGDIHTMGIMGFIILTIMAIRTDTTTLSTTMGTTDPHRFLIIVAAVAPTTIVRQHKAEATLSEVIRDVATVHTVGLNRLEELIKTMFAPTQIRDETTARSEIRKTIRFAPMIVVRYAKTTVTTE